MTTASYTTHLDCPICGTDLRHRHRIAGYLAGAYCCPEHGPQVDAAAGHLRRVFAERRAERDARAQREATVRSRLMAMPEPTQAKCTMAVLLAACGR